MARQRHDCGVIKARHRDLTKADSLRNRERRCELLAANLVRRGLASAVTLDGPQRTGRRSAN